MSFSNSVKNQPKMPVSSSKDPGKAPGWPLRAKETRLGWLRTSRIFPPVFHKDQALLLLGHPPARLPLLDQVLDLHEQRNGAGALAPPEERHLDGSTRSSQPLHIGSSLEGHQVHIQDLIQEEALDAASQVMRVDDAQGLLLQGDVLLVEQDAALKGPGGHEAEGDDTQGRANWEET